MSFDRSKYKHWATFKSTCTARNASSDMVVAKASAANLECLHKLLPDKEIMNKASDLLYVAFNVAVANLINENGDGISGETALAIRDTWKHKFLNIEHDRSQVVGFILDSGFSTFGSNDLVDTPPDIKKPFNIAASGVVWRVVNASVAESLEDANKEGDPYFQEISTSWEIGFNEWVIAKGSKNLATATIISDPKEIKSHEKFLTSSGGRGFDNEGNEVYRVIMGDCIALGAGFTLTPAANVKGVTVYVDESEASIQEPIIQAEASVAEIKEEKTTENEEKISQQPKLSLNPINSMKFNTEEEMFAACASAGVPVADVKDFIGEKLRQANQKWKDEEAKRIKDKEDFDNALAAVKESIKNREANQLETERKTQELAEALAKVQKENEEIKASATLQKRLNDLSSQYELGEKRSTVIANAIKGLSDEDFKSWLKSDLAEILLSSAKKTVVASTPSEEEKVEALTEKMEEATAKVTLSNTSTQATKKAFTLIDKVELTSK